MRRVWLLSLTTLLFVGAVRAETIRLGDLTFDLPQVADFCVMDRNHPVDRQFYEQQERIQAQHNLVLSIAADCREIERQRNGTESPSRWAIWLLNAPGGVPARIPSGTSRAEILAGLAEVMPRLDRAKLDAIMQETLKRESIDLGPNAYGVIDQDRYAVYLGMVGEFAADGAKERVVGVVGMTPIGRSVVSLNLYRLDRGGVRFDELLAEVKRVVKSTVERNDGVAQ